MALGIREQEKFSVDDSERVTLVFESLEYDLNMVTGCRQLLDELLELVNGPPSKRAIVKNALLEAFAMRSRCLYEFFFKEPSKDDRDKPLAKKQYIRLVDIVGAEHVEEIRGAIKTDDIVFLEKNYNYASALAAHIGSTRVRLAKKKRDEHPDAPDWTPSLNRTPRLMGMLFESLRKAHRKTA